MIVFILLAVMLYARMQHREPWEPEELVKIHLTEENDPANFEYPTLEDLKNAKKIFSTF